MTEEQSNHKQEIMKLVEEIRHNHAIPHRQRDGHRPTTEICDDILNMKL